MTFIGANKVDCGDNNVSFKPISKDNQGRPNDLYNIKVLMDWVRFLHEGRNLNYYFQLMKFERIAIYGSGVLGTLLFEQIDQERICICAFIDQKRKGLGDIPAITPDELDQLENIDAVIVTPGFDECTIRNQLREVNAEIIFLDDILENQIIGLISAEAIFHLNKLGEELLQQIKEYHSNLKYRFSQGEVERKEMDIYYRIKNGELVMPLVDLCITTACSLKCKKCFHHIPNYRNCPGGTFSIPFAKLQKDVDKLLSSIDFMVKLNVLGGEPFLYNELETLLQYLLTKENVGYFMIVTNGTIVPNDELCELMADSRIVIHINDYMTGKERVDEIKEKFDRYSVRYGITSEPVWYDFGEIEKHEMSDEVATKHFANCDFSCCKALMDGELHICALAKHTERQGIIPKLNESIMLHEYSKEELRNKLVGFLNKQFFEVCKYCNAPNINDSPKIKSGEQLEC